MAKKLGKKARKFAKKNLQAVQRKKRMFNSKIKRRKSSAPLQNGGIAEDNEKMKLKELTERDNSSNFADGDVFTDNFDNVTDDNSDMLNDISDSDGFLSEDPECPYASENEKENEHEDRSNQVCLSGQNSSLHTDIIKQRKELEALLDKDPGFAEFLESHKAALERWRSQESSSDEEDGSNSSDESEIDGTLNLNSARILTRRTLDVWFPLVTERPDGPALPSLLNAFHAACRYGVDSNDISSQRFQNREVFSEVLTFVLREADGIFRRLLNVSSSCTVESFLKLKATSRWDAVQPLIKSYLRSSLLLLIQITDSQILVFALTRLRASVVLFAAFPSLAARLIKILIHLWATGDENLSVASFFIIRDIASLLPLDYLDTCLTNMYKAFIVHCKFVESTNLKHIEFLRNSTVELYSLDVQKSYPKVLLSVRQLVDVLKQYLRTKRKEELKKIYNWKYINCVELWVKFTTCNIKDHDLRPLLSMMIQLITGIAHLFAGSRFLPLRFKCVHMLNMLSLSSGVFVPVASLVFDCLEYRGTNNVNSTSRNNIAISSLLKAPKNLLKSQSYYDECVLIAIELLASHFSQWSYHITFPELVTIPIILLKKFHERTVSDSIRRTVKRFIDQVEKNSDFIQKKREEVSFSPHDQASVESFLQLEKSRPNAPFTQYYTSVLQNSRFKSLVE